MKRQHSESSSDRPSKRHSSGASDTADSGLASPGVAATVQTPDAAKRDYDTAVSVIEAIAKRNKTSALAQWLIMMEQETKKGKMPLFMSLYNFKGGVAKTTTAFHLAGMLAKQGKRVLLVDADPQCSLTHMCVDCRGHTKPYTHDLATLWKPLFTAGLSAEPLRPAMCHTVTLGQTRDDKGDWRTDECYSFQLLPGSMETMFMDIDTQLCIASTSTLPQFKNVVGGLTGLIRLTAVVADVDIILVDMSPAASLLNRNLLMASDAVIVPCLHDDLSVWSLEHLARAMPTWRAEAERAVENTKNHDFRYPKSMPPKLLAVVVSAVQDEWAANPQTTRIQETCVKLLLPALCPEDSKKKSDSKSDEPRAVPVFGVHDLAAYRSVMYRTHRPMFEAQHCARVVVNPDLIACAKQNHRDMELIANEVGAYFAVSRLSKAAQSV